MGGGVDGGDMSRIAVGMCLDSWQLYVPQFGRAIKVGRISASLAGGELGIGEVVTPWASTDGNRRAQQLNCFENST